MKLLSLDSSQMDEVTISLQNGAEIMTEKKQARNIKGSQVILQSIDTLGKKMGMSVSDIEDITVHTGPGSYTGLRVGAAIGNALAFSLGVRINEKAKGEFVYPIYE